MYSYIFLFFEKKKVNVLTVSAFWRCFFGFGLSILLVQCGGGMEDAPRAQHRARGYGRGLRRSAGRFGERAEKRR